MARKEAVSSVLKKPTDSFVEMICMHAPASEHSLALLITIIIAGCSLNFMLFK